MMFLAGWRSPLWGASRTAADVSLRLLWVPWLTATAIVFTTLSTHVTDTPSPGLSWFAVVGFGVVTFLRATSWNSWRRLLRPWTVGPGPMAKDLEAWCRELAIARPRAEFLLVKSTTSPWPPKPSALGRAPELEAHRGFVPLGARTLDILGLVSMCSLILMAPSSQWARAGLMLLALTGFALSHLLVLCACADGRGAATHGKRVPRHLSQRLLDTQSLLEMGCLSLPRPAKALALATSQSTVPNPRLASIKATGFLFLDQMAAVFLLF